MGVAWSHRGNHFVIYTHIRSLCYTLNYIRLYVSCISVKLGKNYSENEDFKKLVSTTVSLIVSQYLKTSPMRLVVRSVNLILDTM